MRIVRARMLLRVAVAIAVSVAAATPAWAQDAPPRDPWFGEDKVRHLGASAALTAIGYGVARNALDSDGSIVVAVSAAGVAGLLREVHDHRLGKPFSLRDLLWDALGIAAGYLWIREIE